MPITVSAPKVDSIWTSNIVPPGYLPVRAVQLFRARAKLSGLARDLVATGEIVLLSGPWGKKSQFSGHSSVNDGCAHSCDQNLCLAGTHDGLKVVMQLAKHPGGGEPTNVYEIIGDPNLLSFLRAAGTISLDECETLLRKHAERNGVG
jgi:hypothetical protein